VQGLGLGFAAGHKDDDNLDAVHSEPDLAHADIDEVAASLAGMRDGP
jgi:hypothetical protein